MTDYTPVDCALHSEYQLAIMRRQTLRLTRHDIEDELRPTTVLPEDLRTRYHEEFLVIRREGRKGEEIWLHHILCSAPT